MKLANFNNVHGHAARARRRAAWWICRWSSTCRARSGRSGRPSATPRATFIDSFDAAQRSHLARHLRQRRQGHRRDAVQPRVRQDQAEERRAATRCRAAAPTWSRGSIAGGTSCGRFRPAAVGPSHHRAVHRRRVQRRAGQLGRHRRRDVRAQDGFDFPKNLPDPDGQTWNNPQIRRRSTTPQAADATPSRRRPRRRSFRQLPDATTGSASLPLHAAAVTSWHTHHRSSASRRRSRCSTNLAERQRVAQRPCAAALRIGRTGKYPADVWNINNAARNVLEIIANAARNDNGDYQIRIYTIGMGNLVR